MNQTHSNKVQIVEKEDNLKRIEADAMLTQNDGVALCVLTADCAPILIYEKDKKIQFFQKNNFTTWNCFMSSFSEFFNSKISINDKTSILEIKFINSSFH